MNKVQLTSFYEHLRSFNFEHFVLLVLPEMLCFSLLNFGVSLSSPKWTHSEVVVCTSVKLSGFQPKLYLLLKVFVATLETNSTVLLILGNKVHRTIFQF